MTKIAGFNHHSFEEATSALRLMGYEVFNPAENDLEMGFDPRGMTGYEDLTEHGFSLRGALGFDTMYICSTAEAVCILPGWEESKGAVAELALAGALGLLAGTLSQFLSGDLLPADIVFGNSFKTA